MNCESLFGRRKIAAGVIFLAVFLAFGVSLLGSFVWDDHQLIEESAIVRGRTGFSDALSQEIFPETGTNYYRPLQVLSYRLDWFFFQGRPAGFHFTNLLLHGCAAFLLYLCFVELTGKNFLSLAAALLFAVHPIHNEAVAYIAGRADPLSAVFIFLSVWLYLRACTGLDPEKRNLKGVVFSSLLFFVFALLTKETSIILPFFYLGAKFLLEKKGKAGRDILGYFFIGFLYVLGRLTILNFAPADPFLSKKNFSVFEMSLLDRSVIFVKSTALYLGNLFFPCGLHMERFVKDETLGVGPLLGLCLFFLSFIAVVLLSRRKKDNSWIMIFGIYWFFVWLLPQSGFVFPQKMADHFLYIPSAGIMLLVALLLEGQAEVFKKIFVLGFVLLLSLMSFFYSKQWMSDETFFQRTALFSPTSLKAQENLGKMYLDQGKTDRALIHFGRMIDPKGEFNDLDFSTFAQKALQKTHRSKEEEKYVSIAFYNIGVIYAQAGDDEKASIAYLSALELDPGSSRILNNLGVLYFRRGELRKARLIFERTIAIDRLDHQALNNLAGVLAVEGDLRGAIAYWERALALKPGYEMPVKNIEMAKEILTKDAPKDEKILNKS